MTDKLLHPGLGSGALREALAKRQIMYAWPDPQKSGIPDKIVFSVEDWKAVEAALSLSSPIESLTVEEVVTCLWTRSDGSPDPAATTSRLNNLLRKRPSSQASSEIREALELMVKEWHWYAGKHGLGPARLQYALGAGERALSLSSPIEPAPTLRQLQDALKEHNWKCTKCYGHQPTAHCVMPFVAEYLAALTPSRQGAAKRVEG